MLDVRDKAEARKKVVVLIAGKEQKVEISEIGQVFKVLAHRVYSFF
jgi:hypothetical protein